jgi:Zn finger protein HypA/HybF involved in hydrogenase expression
MEGKAPLRKRMPHEQRYEPMNTQILQRPVYSDEQQRALIRCPQCGRAKMTDVAKYQDAPLPPKVQCACGHRFRIPIVANLSSHYRCPQCEGRGYQIIAQGKKVSVSTEGYHYHTLQSREPCTWCHGLGVRYPTAKRGGCPAVFLTTLEYLAETTLRCIDWCAKQVGADGSSLRIWLEMDICALGKR